MSTIPTTRRRPALLRLAVLATAGAVSLGALGSVPAHADTQGAGTASATVDDVVVTGSAIHLEGSGWTGPADGGSTIAVKLGDALDTEPASGPVINPATGESADAFDIWDAISADADGNFSADVAFPTPDNTAPALATAWAVGSTHTLRLLSGSMESGDTGRSVLLTFTVGEGVTISATTGGRGAPAGQVTITATAGTGSFSANEAIGATVDGTPAPWTVGETTAETVTAGDDGSLAGSKLIFTPGTLRAGAHEVVLTGDQGTTVTRTVTLNPTMTFSALTQGSTGTLTLGNLPGGATISAVTLSGARFTGLPVTADESGAAVVSYAIAADAALGSQTATVTQDGPAATYTGSVKISPSDAVSGADRFVVTSTPSGAVVSGLYQSAYSATQHALYATTAYQTTASAEDPTSGWDGTLYKLDPETLAVEASVRAPFVSGEAGARYATYGVGVDDVNGTVWVTNTRQNTVSVYAEDDLAPIAQNLGTVSHARDVVYDPGTNRVFVSSASEGSSGEGYIAVFEAADNDQDGTPYEKITDIATGPRTTFNPVSLTLDTASHRLFSPSLSSDNVAVVDTEDLSYELLHLPGLDVNGRGASGIAYDPRSNHLFVASQNNDELLVADATTGATIKEVPTGTQALNVAFDPVHRLAYVTNFGGTTVTVTDANGTKVANLPIARANHVTADGRGNVYVVDKSSDNKVWRINPKPTLGATTPTISGTVKVGRTVSAKPGRWTGGAKLGYQWLRNGSAIKGATRSAYTAVAADAGRKLSVRVTGTKSGYLGAQRTSAARSVAKGTLSAARPKVAGKARVGKSLAARPGRWTGGTRLHYQWLVNGKRIKGATKATLKVTARFKGKRISVKVSGTKAGYATVVKTSARTAKVTKR